MPVPDFMNAEATIAVLHGRAPQEME